MVEGEPISSFDWSEKCRAGQGIVVVPAPLDLLVWKGELSDMLASIEWEAQFAEGIRQVYHSLERPDFSNDFFNRFDRDYVYQQYVRLVRLILQEKDFPKAVADVVEDDWVNYVEAGEGCR